MKILILDDSPLRLAAFDRNLDGELIMVKTAEQAINWLKTEGFDLIYLDHDLGGKPPEYYGQNCDPDHPNTGSEVIRHMIANPKHYNIIIHSRNSEVVPKMVEQLAKINIIPQCIPFHDLAAHWGEYGIW